MIFLLIEFLGSDIKFFLKKKYINNFMSINFFFNNLRCSFTKNLIITQTYICFFFRALNVNSFKYNLVNVQTSKHWIVTVLLPYTLCRSCIMYKLYRYRYSYIFSWFVKAEYKLNIFHGPNNIYWNVYLSYNIIIVQCCNYIRCTLCKLQGVSNRIQWGFEIP